jgi:hypothetical protein
MWPPALCGRIAGMGLILEDDCVRFFYGGNDLSARPVQARLPRAFYLCISRING